MPDKSITTRLRSLRDSRGVSQDVVAEACNISRVALTRYENGNRVPRVEIASRLADYYGVSVDYILGREQEPITVGLDGGGTVPAQQAFQALADMPKSTEHSQEAQAIIDELLAKLMDIPDDAKLQVLNFADFIKQQEDNKK